MDLKSLSETLPWDWPEKAGKFFLGILCNDQAEESDRILAAELAGDFTVVSDEHADALLSIVSNGDETEELRGAAVISLGPALEHAYIDGFEDADDALISEATYRMIQESLLKLYMDSDVPKEVRRRILEASVRAPEDWHQDAVRTAYTSDDESWKFTAVFCMRYIRGFEDQILEALESENPEIHYQAVRAAGNWEVDAAWSHIAGLATAEDTDKPLLLAVIDAMAIIRPLDSAEILLKLTESDDEDIVEAAFEAMAMAEGLSDDDYGDDDNEFF